MDIPGAARFSLLVTGWDSRGRRLATALPSSLPSPLLTMLSTPLPSTLPTPLLTPLPSPDQPSRHLLGQSPQTNSELVLFLFLANQCPPSAEPASQCPP